MCQRPPVGYYRDKTGVIETILTILSPLLAVLAFVAVLVAAGGNRNSRPGGEG